MKDKTTQEGLQHLIGFANFADAVGLAFGGFDLLGKGAKWALKKGARKASNDYTERLIKLLGDKKDLNTATTKYTDFTSAYADYLKNLGVDMS